MKEIRECPICSNNSFTASFKCIDYSKSKEVFTIVSCETCGFKLTSPRPEVKDLGYYYESENYISHSNKNTGWFNRLYQLVRKQTTRSKLKLIKNNKLSQRHLDIGCGTGEFLHECKKRGLAAFGVEPSKKAREMAINNYDLEVKEDLVKNNFSEKFDSISMWHVLEHIDNLEETVQLLSGMLSENGRLVVAVPNHESWDAKYYKEHWAAWDVPIHLWHFSEKTITALFKKHGFKKIETKQMFWDAYYVSLLSEKYKKSKLCLIKAIVIGTLSNLFGIFSQIGCSSKIYIFENQFKAL